jgi:hypothetical protein
MLHDLRVKSQLGGLEIEKLFVPLTYQGSAQVFIDRLIMSTQSRGGRRSADLRPAETPRPPETPRPAEPKPSVAERPPTPPPTPAAPPAAAPPSKEASGALMDVLSRVDQAASAARTAASDDGKRVP